MDWFIYIFIHMNILHFTSPVQGRGVSGNQASMASTAAHQ